jgi:RNA polymerase sigma-70 factor (ECF subfamily)
VSELARKVQTLERSADAAAIEDAFARYQGELLGTLFYLVGNLEDARDALQDTFVKCWRRRESLGGVENLKAWIFRVALNTGRDVRQTAWRRRSRSLAEGEPLIQSKREPPDAEAACNEQWAMVRQALLDLRQEEQEVFLLRQNGDMTYEEIGEAIGIPTGTVKTRMRLALTKLRRTLASR